MFDLTKVYPFKARTMCLWLCSGCGGPYYFAQVDGAHGGPNARAQDRRYSQPFQGPCWRSKEYGVKCVTPKGWRVIFHEGAPNPEQPNQPDLPNIETIIATRGGRREDNRDQEGGRQ
jgi:hypothetical protein